MSDNKPVTIFVVGHKKFISPDMPEYIPIQAGRAINTPIDGVIGDSTGNNISNKNRSFCELTAIYYVWKNILPSFSNPSNAIIGIAHYRRFMLNSSGNQLIDQIEANNLLERYNFILPMPYYFDISAEKVYCATSGYKKDLCTVRDILADIYPEYVVYFDRRLQQPCGHYTNMFITDGAHFDSYCSFLFDVLFRAEELIDISGYPPIQGRIFGYIAEFMLDVYITAHSYTYLDVPLYWSEIDSDNHILKCDEIYTEPIKIDVFMRDDPGNKAAVLGNTENTARILWLINELIRPNISLTEFKKDVVVKAIVTDQDASERIAPEALRDIDMMSYDTLVASYSNGNIDIIILPLNEVVGLTTIVTDLIRDGVNLDDIYCISRDIMSKSPLTSSDIPNIIQRYTDTPYLPYLEYQICDHCNLNCKACEHFSPLVKGEKFTDYNRFKKDLTKLKHYIDDIGIIRIMGGEPLLNKELDKYIILTRALYPHTTIYVVTNALLLSQASEELLWLMRETGTLFSISYYLPLMERMHDIIDRLNTYGVRYFLSPIMETFGMKYTLKGNSEMKGSFYNCLQAHRNNLYEGRIAACFLPFTQHYFNEALKKDIPCDGAIDLYEEDLTTNSLKMRLLIPFERCRFCNREIVNVPWTQANRTPTLSDWVIDSNINAQFK